MLCSEASSKKKRAIKRWKDKFRLVVPVQDWKVKKMYEYNAIWRNGAYWKRETSIFEVCTTLLGVNLRLSDVPERAHEATSSRQKKMLLGG